MLLCKCLPLSICVILCFMTDVNAWRKQRVKAKGIVHCGGKTEAGIRVRLMDDDTGPDPDDVLDAGYTLEDGSFYLEGSTRELTNIDPVLKVYHDCNDYEIPCQRKWAIVIPDKYINKGVYDMGRVNLEIEMEDEERDCIH